jgi:prepilin-type N-terminal cleavage/methylation domain-containing protein
LRHGRRGFTLIELLIGVALVAVLVALGLPAWSEYRNKVRVRQAVQDITQMQAVIRQHFDEARSYPGRSGCGGSVRAPRSLGSCLPVLPTSPAAPSVVRGKNRSLNPAEHRFRPVQQRAGQRFCAASDLHEERR